MAKTYEGWMYVDDEEGELILQLMTEPGLGDRWYAEEHRAKRVVDLAEVLKAFEGKHIRVTIEEAEAVLYAAWGKAQEASLSIGD